jgi:mRNA interferase RelE/StbE
LGSSRYTIVYMSDVLDKQIKLIPKYDREKIKNLIETRLTNDPYDRGKPLGGKWKGCWRLRSGIYRIIYKVDDNILKVYVIRIRHRKDVYD